MMAFAVCLVLLSQQPSWADILHDAQVSNKAKLRQGHAKLELIYSPLEGDKGSEVTLYSDISWHDDDIFEEYRFRARTNVPFGRKNERSLEDTPPDYFLRDSSGQFLFNGDAKLLSIDGLAENRLPPLIDVHPMRLWFSYAPPGFMKARPWTELMNLIVTEQDGRKSVVEFLKIDPNRIMQRRTDPNGEITEIVYSLDQGGNVTQFDSFPSNGQGLRMKSTYHWKNDGGLYVPEACDFYSDNVFQPGKTHFYRVRVTDIKISAVDTNLFTKEHLMSLMPAEDYQVRNHIANTYVKVPRKSGVGSKDLRLLTPILRSRGYAKESR